MTNEVTRTKPLILVVFERLVPGSQLVQKLEKMDYEVKTLRDASELPLVAPKLMPLIVIVDLYSSYLDVCSCIERVKKDPATQHLPIIAFSNELKPEWEQEATRAGAKFVLPGNALLTHLEDVIDQALEVE